jgi:CsoR family transcriptional regulator, copper-sensing transcriptional repressor
MEKLHDVRDRKAIVLRLKRIEGQLRGLQAMIDEGKDCEQIAQQMSAARRSLDKTFFAMVACMVGGGSAADSKAGILIGGILSRYG